MMELTVWAVVATVFTGILVAIMFVAASRILAAHKHKSMPGPASGSALPPPPQRKGLTQRHMEMYE